MELSFRTDKITRVLMLYDRLVRGQSIDKASFSSEHGINERSFDRDIEDVRLFLSESFSAREVIFDKETGTYHLTGDNPVFLDRMDATLIAKTLISSHAFRHDEMIGLYNAILSTVVPKDAAAIKDYLFQDVQSYTTATNSAILKVAGDLYEVIHHGVDIELTLHDAGQTVTKQVSPLDIEIVDSSLLLVAAVNMNLSCIERYPMEVIENFKALPTTFSKNMQEQYYCKKKEYKDEVKRRQKNG